MRNEGRALQQRAGERNCCWWSVPGLTFSLPSSCYFSGGHFCLPAGPVADSLPELHVSVLKTFPQLCIYLPASGQCPRTLASGLLQEGVGN